MFSACKRWRFMNLSCTTLVLLYGQIVIFVPPNIPKEKVGLSFLFLLSFRMILSLEVWTLLIKLFGPFLKLMAIFRIHQCLCFQPCPKKKCFMVVDYFIHATSHLDLMWWFQYDWKSFWQMYGSSHAMVQWRRRSLVFHEEQTWVGWPKYQLFPQGLSRCFLVHLVKFSSWPK